MKKKHPILVRETDCSDGSELRILLNEIIEIGGSTAIEFPLSSSEFDANFLCGSGFICNHIAQSRDGEVLGFQALSQHSELPAKWADIATFSRVSPKVPGVGTALFKKTIPFARHAGVEVINATIRADNVSGLSYYSKMGFIDYAMAYALPLSDGTPVDRISKKFRVGCA